MAETIGVVLCGGTSSRMGRDKGLISENGITWAERAANLLGRHMARVVLSLRADQVEAYARVFGHDVLVADTFAEFGPLGGLISVHKNFPSADIFLLACDMTAVTDDNVRQILTKPGDLVAYRHGEIFEPLCAYYSARACSEILQRVEAQGDRVPGLQRLLHEMRVTAIEASGPENLTSRNLPQ